MSLGSKAPAERRASLTGRHETSATVTRADLFRREQMATDHAQAQDLCAYGRARSGIHRFGGGNAVAEVDEQSRFAWGSAAVQLAAPVGFVPEDVSPHVGLAASIQEHLFAREGQLVPDTSGHVSQGGSKKSSRTWGSK